MNVDEFKRFGLLLITTFFILFFFSFEGIGKGEGLDKTLIVAGITNSPSIEFLSSSNIPRGVYVELWKLWSLKTGIKIDYIILEPEEALKKLSNSEIDVIMVPDRFLPASSDFQPTAIVYLSEYFIYTNKRVPPVESVNALIPYRVGAALNDMKAVEGFFPGLELVYKDSVDDLIKASAAGEFNVFIAEEALVNHRLTSKGEWGNFIQSYLPAGSQGVRALVKSGNNDLIEAINSGFNSITDTERLFIEKTWVGGNFKYRISWGYIAAVAVIVILLSGVIIIWLWNFRLQKKVDEATEELKQMKDAAEAASVAKGRFLDNISHELRTPLTLILAPLDKVLKDGAAPDDDLLKIIKKNSLYLLNLINDLLYLSGIRKARAALYVSEVDLVLLIKNICEEIKPAADKKGLSINCSFPFESVKLFIDIEKFCRVILNFFSNSLKYTEPGGFIFISIKNTGDEITLKFSDTGSGIPLSDIDTIFNRFNRIDGVKRRDKEGTGIGLAIVKELVELMGGTISVSSRYIEDYPHNHGTDFYVMLPSGKEYLNSRDDVVFVKGTDGAASYNVPCDYNLPAPVVVLKNQDETLLHDEKPAILVVEDNEDMLNFLVKLLGDEFRVFSASNGVRALEVLGKEEFVDLILSDVMMPEMDGYEFMKIIRSDERYEEIPLLFLTARDDDLFKQEGLSMGAVDYVTKPFNSEELKLRIKNQMELSLMHKKLRIKNEELYAKLKKRLEKKEQAVTSDNIKKIEEICLFIKENLSEDLNRDMLASAAGMNPDTFSRIFNRHKGINLSDYINRQRVDIAIKMLEITDKTITRIAMETGFESLRTFNRAFKKVTGESPGDYRARVKKQLVKIQFYK